MTTAPWTGVTVAMERAVTVQLVERAGSDDRVERGRVRASVGGVRGPSC